GSVRAALLEVVTRARQRLVALQVRDESATLAALAHVDDAVLAELRLVLVVTDTFHPAQLPFVARLARQPLCRVVTIIPADADLALAEQLGALGAGTIPPAVSVAPPRVVSCPDPDEEVRHAVRHCTELIDSGVPADEITVVCAARQYRRPVRDELQRAGVAWSGGAVEQLRGAIAGQALRHVLDGVVGEWDRPAVFRLLAVAPVYPLGEYGAPRRIGQWTSLCRRLGLVTVDDWERAPLALVEANASRRRRWPGDDPDGAPTRREVAESEGLERLLSLVSRLEGQSRRVRRATTWTAASRELATILGDHIGAPSWRERAWADGPAWQRNAADHVERLVAGLAELDHDGVAVPYAPATMRQIVSTLLETPVRRRGDAAGAVSIVDISGAVCLDAAHVFVVGVNEGVLPAAVGDDLLLGRDLPPDATEVVEGPRSVASRAERAWHSLLQSDAAVTAFWARADLRRGGAMHASPLLGGLPSEHHESHEAGLRSGHPLSVSEQFARAADPASASSRIARRANALRARLEPKPNEFDGMVGAHAALAAPGKQWSITAVEAQARCGLGYFGQHVLHLSEEVDAATIIAIEPKERGVLVHSVFEQLAAEWLAVEKPLRQPWLQGEHLSAMHQRAAEVLDELAAGFGVQHRLGHPSAWSAERAHLLRSIAAVLDAEAAEHCSPVACEHSFSGVPVGGALFRGNIDRIDLMPDGGLRVTDYKTGANIGPTRNVLDSGRSLQLPLYARAADHDGQLLTGQDRADAPPATARYLQVRDAKATSRPVNLDPALIVEFEAYVERWLSEIAAGYFVPRPHPSNGRCLMCCVDSLGIEELGERARLFEPAATE
ncbi:MAG TPA: PD-(D/E)XK nuclease family protein, partial [Ilumatobacteraceae bacterium]|nr:PD-(D/E)XK nuclease family protein [Ilumatobacteraceae bacterium]